MKHRCTPWLANRVLPAVALCATLFSMPGGAAASGLSVPVGLVFEHNFYNQFGVRASVAHELLLEGHPRLTVSYTTSRLSAFAGRNVLKQDNVLFNAAWYFRPGKLVDPYAGIDAGFTRFDREDDDLFALLDNRSGMLNVRVGISSSLLGARVRPSIDGGLAILSLTSSASQPVYPLFFSVGVAFDIAKGVLP